jgi:6-pyruvoyltetrahydropterin/6-carboxytetrahydropterin synthase
MYYSTKTYTHAVGLSCAFRQWKAWDSHCRFLHGYALEIKLTFKAHELDIRNWVVDFGSMKSLKGWLEKLLDHTTLVADDDPLLEYFRVMHGNGAIDMRVIPATGCEALAYYIWEYVDGWLVDNGYKPRCTLESVEVREHAGNSAIFKV